MFATNTTVLFEYWHGIDLPPWGFAIPKAFAAAIVKTPKKPTGFGFGERSVTIWFEDGSWLKTQLFNVSEWPNIDKQFEYTFFPSDVPEGLFEGVRAIERFSEDGGIHFHDGKLKTTYDNYRGEADGPVYGASYEVPGLQPGHTFSANLLRLIEPVVTMIDYTSVEDRAFFFGDMLRGVIMKRRTQDHYPSPDAYKEAVAEEQASMADRAIAAVVAECVDPNAAAWASINPAYDVAEDDIPF
jgi:hypothetical protein